jgi:uncharacterized protein YhjY with autotransporter beta-barrel domain
MNSGDIKFKVGRCAFISRFFVAVVVVVIGAGVMPQYAAAAGTDVQYKLYLDALCAAGLPPGATWNPIVVGQMCNAVSAAGAASSANFSVNLGTSNAGGAASRKKKGVHEYLNEQQDKSAKGASADGAGWGFLITPQYGNSNRTETEKENGYQSVLKGVVVGLDYRYSDSFVLGGTIGQTNDAATFFGNAGSLKTNTNTLTIYGTWLPEDSIAIDGYMGYGKIKLDSQRKILFGSITGIASGNTSGSQVMGGVSASYTKSVGNFSLSPYVGLDSIKTTFDSYNEVGSTLLELHFSDHKALSVTSNLGVRMNSSYSYDWGALLPSAHVSAVHEFQNNSRQISNELVITPGAGFVVETDSPDRNYFNIGLGVVAALNGGTQLFLDYEKRTQDKLLSSWAVSLGGLFEF